MALAAALAWLILPSCRKERLLLEEDPDAIGKFCKIDTFNFGPPSDRQEQMKISYNSNGDPVTELPLTSFLFGNAFDDFYFRYDKYHRLVDLFYVFPTPEFSGGDIDLWHRYTYPSPGIVIDSFFNYDGPGIPPVANPPTGYTNLTVSRYELDEKGRTIKNYTQYISPGAPQADFNDTFYTRYDGRGNVVIPGVTYDNKINIYRTNKVWQLVFQNYSMNNPVYTAAPYPPSIVSYNKLGLPILLVTNPAQQQLPFFNGIFPVDFYMSVSYSCDEATNKLQP